MRTMGLNLVNAVSSSAFKTFSPFLILKLKEVIKTSASLTSTPISATTPKADFVDLTGMATVQQLFTGDGNDHVFTGSNPRGLHIDTGTGDDTIYITTKIKTLITGAGIDHIYLKPEFLNNKPNPIGYYFKPSYHKNGDQIIKALTFIDGDRLDTLEIDHKLLKIILEEHSQDIFNRQASGDLARIMGGESSDLGKKLYSMLPPIDSKINTHVKGIGSFKYTLPKNKKDWMPSLRASQLKRKKESVDLNYSTPALNGLSTGDSQLDSMIFLDDYKSAFNSVFKSKVPNFFTFIFLFKTHLMSLSFFNL